MYLAAHIRRSQLLRILQEHGERNTWQLMEHTGLSYKRVNDYLRELYRKGQVHRRRLHLPPSPWSVSRRDAWTYLYSLPGTIDDTAQD